MDFLVGAIVGALAMLGAIVVLAFAKRAGEDDD